MKNLILNSNVNNSSKNKIISVVQNYWNVFREDDVKITIQGYEMIIYMGDHKSITVKKPHYALHETPIM